MSGRETFDRLVREFGQDRSQELALDELDACAFRFGDTAEIGHFQFLPKSDNVVLWATVGFLPPDAWAPLRVVRLLQMQDFGAQTHGFVLGAEKGTGRLVAFSRRALSELDGVGALAGWSDLLEAAVKDVRQAMVDEFPVETDDFNISEVELGDEGEGL